jgi:Tc toxin complex TcA C-terminal TcB-binding domain
MTSNNSRSFHSYYDAKVRPHQVYHPKHGWTVLSHSKDTKTEERHLNYQFYLHAHPYVQELINRLALKSIAGLEAADTEYVKRHDGTLEPLKDDRGKTEMRSDGTPIPRPVLFHELFSRTSYRPGNLVEHPYPVMDLDFTSSDAYSGYNWELFYHVPMTIAIHLSQNQRYEDAQKWFHYVFDPTDDSSGPTPERFWKVKPFQSTDVKMVEEILVNLSSPSDSTLQQDTVNAIDAWKHNPFRPFLVARYRQTAFMFKAVMAYLDNLIAWGDNLFSQYTGETINEAAQIYILASHILGPRPQPVPGKGGTAPQTYASLRSHMDQFGNAMVNMETEMPFDAHPHPSKAAAHTKLGSVSSTGHSLYFCTPRNDKLLQYWDTVADRLFKIRNSLNIQGIFQRVPLFEPPIDPALLARAAAAGLDVGSIVSGLNQPLPLVRFQYLLQKASEICQEVKSLGSNLLSAMEKKDNEALSLLRANHETAMLKLAESVKYSALQEAIKNREGLEQSLQNAAAKYIYYQRLLGKKESDIKIPRLDPIDESSLKHMRFKSNEPVVTPESIDVDIAKDLGDSGGFMMSSHEADEMGNLKTAHDIQMGTHIYKAIASGLRPIPDPKAALHFWGIGIDIGLVGGEVISDIVNFASDISSAIADQFTYQATSAGKVATYANRQRDYQFQSNAAAGEITQLFKQLRASEIREAMAKLELEHHRVQIKQSEKIEEFLKDKPTNEGLYVWMKREVKGLYGKSFQLAFEVARKAERALQQEIGDPNLTYIEYGYLAGKEGLLAGEKLYHDLKRMEMAYADLNKREYEITKHISLLQVNPLGLLQLRATGSCTFSLPEELFDFDCPGQYFRRLRSVAVSIPCVVGPFTSLNCRLTLSKSSIRTTSLAGDDFTRQGPDDPRFSDFMGSMQAIVTSTGQNDSGLFETSLHDERKLPFEWSGAIGEWQLDLLSTVRQFDFNTISDVILHLRYTAREGGDALRAKAVKNLEDAIDTGKTAGSVRLFSMRHEFPSDWAKFKSVQVGNATPFAALTVTIRPEHYPFWSQGRLESVLALSMYAASAKDLQVSDSGDGTGNVDNLTSDDSLGGLRSGTLKNVPLPPPIGAWTFYLSDNSMVDLWLAAAWGRQS